MNTGETDPKDVPFTAAEIEGVTQAPLDSELDEIEPAEIDERTAEVEAAEKPTGRGRRMEAGKLRAALESILFVADRPLTLDELRLATGVAQDVIAASLAELVQARQDGASGIVLHEVGGGWQLRTATESAEFVRKFLQVKPQRLTRAALETLAIIAYRQPVTRPEVEDVRGVDSGAVMKALLERKLIKMLGKKEEIGRPILYGTSREFLEFFALRDLTSLPTLREFQELSREHQEIVERETAPKEAPPPLEALADPAFRERLEASQGDAEEALAALEDAISVADRRAKGTQATLTPPPEDDAELAADVKP
jgi:segregation and condensation protein B